MSDIRSRRDETLAPVDDVRVSRFLSLVLRHQPSVVGVRLDPGGWIDVDELVAAFEAGGQRITRADVECVVDNNDKQRFTIDPTLDRIRASQGHSFAVDLGLSRRQPPESLFHGTASSSVEQILRQGIHRASRHAVHLSPDEATATAVGARRGRHTVLRVDAERMHADGHEFTVSANGVWLVEAVPGEYLAIESHR